MNVKEMIEALQQQDPNVPARDAIKVIQRQKHTEHQQRLLTEDGIIAFYPILFDRIAGTKDSKGNGCVDDKLETFNALRSEVHEAMQTFNPAPLASDLEKTINIKSEQAKKAAIHEIQKAHNIELWEKTDELIAAAGITAEGGV